MSGPSSSLLYDFFDQKLVFWIHNDLDLDINLKQFQ